MRLLKQIFILQSSNTIWEDKRNVFKIKLSLTIAHQCWQLRCLCPCCRWGGMLRARCKEHRTQTGTSLSTQMYTACKVLGWFEAYKSWISNERSKLKRIAKVDGIIECGEYYKIIRYSKLTFARMMVRECLVHTY